MIFHVDAHAERLSSANCMCNMTILGEKLRREREAYIDITIKVKTIND